MGLSGQTSNINQGCYCIRLAYNVVLFSCNDMVFKKIILNFCCLASPSPHFFPNVFFHVFSKNPPCFHQEWEVPTVGTAVKTWPAAWTAAAAPARPSPGATVGASSWTPRGPAPHRAPAPRSSSARPGGCEWRKPGLVAMLLRIAIKNTWSVLNHI